MHALKKQGHGMMKNLYGCITVLRHTQTSDHPHIENNMKLMSP